MLKSQRAQGIYIPNVSTKMHQEFNRILDLGDGTLAARPSVTATLRAGCLCHNPPPSAE